MAKTLKKDTTSNPMVAILIIVALALGLVLGMTLVSRTQQTASEAAGTDQINQSYDNMVNRASLNNNRIGNGGALPNGFKSCYDDCRQEGNPGAICFFACVR